MIDKEKAKLNPRVQWTKFVIAIIAYLLFLYWVGSWWGLLVVPFIFDVYITKKIRWQWWKDSEGPTRFIMSWVHQPFLLSKLRYPLKLIRKEPPHRRLSLRKQGELWTKNS